MRTSPTNAAVCIHNFKESWAALGADWAAAQGATQFTDGLSGNPVGLQDGRIRLPPYARLRLR